MVLIPEEFLFAAATAHELSEAESAVLFDALKGWAIADIAKHHAITPEAVKKRLSEVYKKFQVSGVGPGKLSKLQRQLEASYQSQQSDRASSPNLSVLPQSANIEMTWDSAPDASVFYGRETEQGTLKQWILDDQCRLISVLGMRGIGKTLLVRKVTQEIQPKFERIIWRSLQACPTLSQILGDYLDEGSSAASLEPEFLISQVVERWRQQRHLLILDGLEAVLQGEALAGHYQPGYAAYGNFLQRVATESHQSCLVLTSLENPKEVAQQAGPELMVRSLTLEGLAETDAQAILQAKGLQDRNHWSLLIQFYRGNPLALKLVATTIVDLFNGRVAEFLSQGMLVFGDVQDLLEEPFNRLSSHEKSILYWLVILHLPCALTTLQQVWQSGDQRELLAVLSSLVRRSLIETTTETGSTTFTLQPVTVEYIQNRFVDLITQEVIQLLKGSTGNPPELLSSHALLISNHEDTDIPASSKVLQRIVARLRAKVTNKTQLKDKLSKIHQEFTEQPSLNTGWLSNNIDSLLQELSADGVQQYELLH